MLYAIALENMDELVLIDKEDAQLVTPYRWFGIKQTNGICAVANIKEGEKWKAIRIHTFLMQPRDGLVVDHINHNTLDNRRKNLRLCTRQQNRFNSKPNKNTKSIYKGVSPQNGKWRARITHNGQKKSLGMFKTEEEAALAYNKEAARLQGEFSFLNVL